MMAGVLQNKGIYLRQDAKKRALRLKSYSLHFNHSEEKQRTSLVKRLLDTLFVDSNVCV